MVETRVVSLTINSSSLLQLGVILQLAHQEVGESEDAGKRAVDLMGHAGSQPSERSQFLRLHELRLDLLQLLAALLHLFFQGPAIIFQLLAGLLEADEHMIERLGQLPDFIFGGNGEFQG